MALSIRLASAWACSRVISPAATRLSNVATMLVPASTMCRTSFFFCSMRFVRLSPSARLSDRDDRNDGHDGKDDDARVNAVDELEHGILRLKWDGDLSQLDGKSIKISSITIRRHARRIGVFT